MVEAVGRHWGFEPEPEITLEANPTSVEADRFAAYRAAGVNRLSLGVQALDDAALVRLGRQHGAAEALAALDIAMAAFEAVSIDLIYARPGQGLADWRAELSRALGLGTGHLSLYQLTIEPGTRFFDWHARGQLQVPEPELAADLYEATGELTAAAGLAAYEISNHARPGAACRHNLVYWQGGGWAGVGPGAHARLGGGDTRRALATERDPAAWLANVREHGHGVVTDEALTPGQAADELLVTALRTSAGLDLARHRALGGAIAAEKIAPLEDDGLVRLDAADRRLRLTGRGRLVANAVIAELAG
jgi:oxygen-independent coproporphyrinogen-3 oxidase